MFPTPKACKEALTRYPYYGVGRASESPHPGAFLGYFLDHNLPAALRGKSPDANPDDRFILLASGFQHAWPFYPLTHPQATLLQVAATEQDYSRLRYQKPSKITSLIRQGQAGSYLEYMERVSLDLLPLISYFYCASPEEMKEAYLRIQTLLEQRRIGVIVTGTALPKAFRATVKSALRCSITLAQSAVRVPDMAAITRSDVELAPFAVPDSDKFLFGDIALHFFGTGTTHKEFSLQAPDPANLSSWETAFRYVTRFVVDATLSEDLVLDHLVAVKKHLAAEEGLVPHLHAYPAPPALPHLGAVTLTRRLKTKSDPLTDALLSYDNATLQLFNPVVGRATGAVDALLSRPTLLSRRFSDTQELLSGLGYRLELSPQQAAQLEERRRFYEMQIAPLKPVSGLECLAYYQPDRYPAKRTIYNPDTGQAVWTKGKTYAITPNWRKQTFPGSSEPVVDSEGAVVGLEEFTVRYSVLTLEVETNDGIVPIAENACREMLEPPKDGKVEPWTPLLDEFLKTFDLPKVQTALDLRPNDFRRMREQIIARLPHLKGYQADLAVLNAMKRGGIMGSEMGAGKTYQAIAVILLRNKAFNLVVVPPMLVPQWLKAFRDCNVWARPLLTHGAVNQLQRHFKRIQRLKPADKRARMHAPQECYVTTPEFLSLGGSGNRVYDEWKANFIVYGEHKPGEPLQRTRTEVVGTRCNVSSEVRALELGTYQTHQYSGVVKKCPKCSRERAEGFSYSGVCRCGYRAFSYRGTRRRVDGRGGSSRDWIFGSASELPVFADTRDNPTPGPAQATVFDETYAVYDGTKHILTSHPRPQAIPGVQQKVASDYYHPAYRRLRKIFGLKVIDEVHLIANLDSAKGAAVRAIHADETFVMSGTISRGYVTDIESALTHVHEPETPCFPFAPWDRHAFREQFVTERVKVTSYFDRKGTKTSSTIVPEASNVNRLRRMLNCVTTRVDEALLEAEWRLPPPTRRYVEVKLTPSNQDYYNKVLAGVASWYKYASKVDRHRNAMSKLWELRHICENGEKVAVIASFVRQWVREGHKFVIVSPTRYLYGKIRDMLRDCGLRILAIDDSAAPERRQELSSRFSDSLYQGLVSRTRLVCTGLNTLVHADRLIIAGGEYSPAAVRQMEKRLIRPGQKSDRVEIIYPIVRMSPRHSIEEEMLKLLLLKEASVNEVTKGTVRWIKPAMLVESAMESKGAARVLDALAGDVSIGDMDLDRLFAQLEAPQAEVTARPLPPPILDSMGFEMQATEEFGPGAAAPAVASSALTWQPSEILE